MGTATSCNRNCGRQAFWAIELDHQEFDTLRNKIDPDGLGNLFNNLHLNFESARKLTETIRPIVGPAHLSYPGKMRVACFMCNQCFKKTNLKDLPDEWGYEASYSRSGYYHK